MKKRKKTTAASRLDPKDINKSIGNEDAPLIADNKEVAADSQEGHLLWVGYKPTNSPKPTPKFEREYDFPFGTTRSGSHPGLVSACGMALQKPLRFFKPASLRKKPKTSDVIVCETQTPDGSFNYKHILRESTSSEGISISQNEATELLNIDIEATNYINFTEIDERIICDGEWGDQYLLFTTISIPRNNAEELIDKLKQHPSIVFLNLEHPALTK